MLKLTIGFSSLCTCLSNKMLHSNAPLFPLRYLSPQKVTKMLNSAHHIESDRGFKRLILMLVTKTHKICSIEITYISYSFNTAKHNPINGCIRILHLTFIFNFDSSLTLKKSYNFPGKCH